VMRARPAHHRAAVYPYLHCSDFLS